MTARPQDPYTTAGVDYSALDPSKLNAQRAALATAQWLPQKGLNEVPSSRGESAYVVDFGDHYVSSVTEALGTKNLVADAVRNITGKTHYDCIARDAVATVLNDLASVGGRAISLTAYWGAGSSEWFSDAQRMADLVQGWSTACNDARCSWGGGETQVLTGIIAPNAAVLGGSAIGWIKPKEHFLHGDRITVGDAILLAPASGIHANGLTLARSIASQLPQGYATPIPGDPSGRSYGETLLDPTPLYGILIEALQHAGIELHYTAHITGHGFRKLMRAASHWTYVIERLPEVNPIFQFLVEHAEMTPKESYGTFNMGAGYAVYLPQAEVPRAQDIARSVGFNLLHAGHVEVGPKRVIVNPLSITFSAETLQLR